MFSVWHRDLVSYIQSVKRLARYNKSFLTTTRISYGGIACSIETQAIANASNGGIKARKTATIKSSYKAFKVTTSCKIKQNIVSQMLF